MSTKMAECLWPMFITPPQLKMDQTIRQIPVGVLVMRRWYDWERALAAVKEHGGWPIGHVTITWAFANPNEPFNRRRGLEIARGRSITLSGRGRGPGLLADYQPFQSTVGLWDRMHAVLRQRAERRQGYHDIDEPRYLVALRHTMHPAGGAKPPRPPCPQGAPPGDGWEELGGIPEAHDPTTELYWALQHWQAYADRRTTYRALWPRG